MNFKTVKLLKENLTELKYLSGDTISLVNWRLAIQLGN
jgi:hypothetical protein